MTTIDLRTEDVADNDPMTSGDSAATATTAPPSARRGWFFSVVLLAITVGLLVAGTIFLVRTAQLDDKPGAGNEALVDRTQTTEVIAQVSTALNHVLSYDYRTPQTAQAAVKKWLTGDAPAQYATLFKQLQSLAQGQKLTFVARVSTAAVTSLRGDTAQLLVFLDQKSTRASDGQSSVSAAQVQVTAVRDGGRYRISELVPL